MFGARCVTENEFINEFGQMVEKREKYQKEKKIEHKNAERDGKIETTPSS